MPAGSARNGRPCLSVNPDFAIGEKEPALETDRGAAPCFFQFFPWEAEASRRPSAGKRFQASPELGGSDSCFLFPVSCFGLTAELSDS
jgi:hypothetical protein